MKKGLIIDSKILANALKDLNKIKGDCVPIIAEYMAISSKNDGTLKLIKTNLQVWQIKTLRVETNFDGGFMLTQDVLKLAAKVKQQPLSIYIEENNTVKVCGDKFSTSIQTENPDDFPIENLSFENKYLVSGLYETFEKLFSFTSNDQLRPSMTGFYFDGENKSIVATDGHRVRVIKAEIPDKSFILPSYIFKLMDKKQNDYKVSVASNGQHEYIYLSSGENEFIVKAIDERYPDYKSVFPADFTTIIEAKNSDLFEAIEQALIFANPITYQIVFNLNGSIKISADDIDRATHFDTEIKHNCKLGNDLVIGFNGKMFLECLKVADETLLFNFNNPGNGVVINYDENDLILLMPVMIKNE